MMLSNISLHMWWYICVSDAAGGKFQRYFSPAYCIRCAKTALTSHSPPRPLHPSILSQVTIQNALKPHHRFAHSLLSTASLYFTRSRLARLTASREMDRQGDTPDETPPKPDQPDHVPSSFETPE